MHRVFGIAELVEEIVAYLDQNSLTVLARTATFFEQPTYAALYYCAYNRSLSSLLWTVQRASGQVNEPEQKLRYLYRASLIRHVDIVESLLLTPYTSRPHMQEWKTLQESLDLLRQPLYPFPNLRSLHVRTEDPHMITLAGLVLCPTLVELSLDLRIVRVEVLHLWEGPIIDLLAGLAAKSSHISSIGMFLDDYPDQWRADFESLIAHAMGQACSYLPLVEISTQALPVTAELFHNLASVDSLVTMRLMASPCVSIPFDVERFRGLSQSLNGFQCLKEVEITGTDAIIDIFGALNGVELQSLHLRLAWWGPRIAILLESICSFSGSLKELTIYKHNQHVISSAQFQSYRISGQTFTSLARCSRMQIFTFMVTDLHDRELLLIDLHNSDLDCMASAWADLHEFVLQYGWTSSPSVPITMEVFLPFSLHCRELAEISINPMANTLALEVPHSAVLSHPWAELEIGLPHYCKDLKDTVLVKIAVYLDTIWPDVYLHVFEDHFSNDGDMCKKLNYQLSRLRIARAMRPGSRWLHTQRQRGSCSLADVPDFDTFDNLCGMFPRCPSLLILIALLHPGPMPALGNLWAEQHHFFLRRPAVVDIVRGMLLRNAVTKSMTSVCQHISDILRRGKLCASAFYEGIAV